MEKLLISRAVCGPARGPAVFGGPQPALADFRVARIGSQLKFGLTVEKFVKFWLNLARKSQPAARTGREKTGPIQPYQALTCRGQGFIPLAGAPILQKYI